MLSRINRLSATLAVALAAASPLRANTPYGYVANAGWMHFAPSGGARIEARDTFLRGFAYAENFGWVDFGDGAPAGGAAYGNTFASDFGVNHDGRGELSGYAYSANVGWINFSWASASDPNRPRVDLVTGEAAGFAYSANIGWINLAGLTMPGVTAAVHFPSDNPSATAGSSLTLSAGVFGSEPLTFQWLFNGVPIPGATGATLSLTSAQAFHAGAYSVVITRADSSTFPVAAASLTIAAPPPNDARLLNLSTRGLAQSGDNVLIPGFVIDGTMSKKLLIRAVGPTLAQDPFKLGGTLPDPTMTLKRLNTSATPPAYVDVASNDDWGTNTNAAAIAQTAAEIFAFAFKDAKESALLLDLAPGQYTAIAGDKNGASGIGIVELYDADTTSSGSRLINISNRGFCGVGDRVMIPGFVVSSEGSKTFLIRVVGPTLGGAPFNVSGTMADPKLEIFPGGAASPILANDNWGANPDATTTVAVGEEVFAFPLATGSQDAAFVVTLQPGSYTVVGSSAIANGTGVVLVEVYVVP